MKYLLMGLVIVASTLSTSTLASEIKNADYFAFDIKRLNGIPEGQIATEGCAYLINIRSFTSALQPLSPQGQNYAPSDVRVRIIMDEGEDYFIDNAGRVKRGAERFQIDKLRLDGMLILKHKKRCR